MNRIEQNPPPDFLESRRLDLIEKLPFIYKLSAKTSKALDEKFWQMSLKKMSPSEKAMLEMLINFPKENRLNIAENILQGNTPKNVKKRLEYYAYILLCEDIAQENLITALEKEQIVLPKEQVELLQSSILFGMAKGMSDFPNK